MSIGTRGNMIEQKSQCYFIFASRFETILLLSAQSVWMPHGFTLNSSASFMKAECLSSCYRAERKEGGDLGQHGGKGAHAERTPLWPLFPSLSALRSAPLKGDIDPSQACRETCIPLKRAGLPEEWQRQTEERV